MREKTREKLQVIVDKADLMADWGFSIHLREEGLSHNMSWSAERPEGQKVEEISRVLPSQEQIAATLLLIRFFTQANEGICLFRNDWISPNQSHRAPDWLNDPGLSANWRLHYEDNQAFLNRVLAAHNQGHHAVLDGRIVTRGMIFEAFAYGETLHSTDRPAQHLARLRSTLLGPTSFEFEFCKIVTNIMFVIQRMASVTKMELAGESVPPVPTE